MQSNDVIQTPYPALTTVGTAQNLNKINLFDQSLVTIDLSIHKEIKEHASKVVEDIANNAMNTNNFHHSSVHQTPPGLQMNNAFIPILQSQEMEDFVSVKTSEYILPAEKELACLNMWATIIPPGGILLPKSYQGLIYGSYFLHSPQNSGMYTIEALTPSSYFNGLGNVMHNEHNHNLRAFNMPEGGIYLAPSYLRFGTTTNGSDSVAIQINFVLDVIDK